MAVPLSVLVSSVLLLSAPALAQPAGGTDVDRGDAAKAAPADAKAQSATTAPEIARFTVRKGFTVTPATPKVSGARFLAVGDKGELYVSRPRQGDILRFTEPDAQGVFTKQTTFVSGKPSVHGLQFADGELWFSTTGAIYRAKDADGDGVAEAVTAVIPENQLPKGGGHWWRSILVTADSIYTSIGDSGNITDQTTTDRQKIWRFKRDGSDKTLFASGIRNTEKLMLRPGTQEIWGFDHGSDWFGKEVGDEENNQPITDINPPDELNKYVEGGFYGHPFVVGNRLPRYEYLKRPDIHNLAAKTIPPEWPVGAHWATNGWTFLDPARTGAGKGMPAEFAGDVLVACHGSWNSQRKVGYCVARVMFDDGHPVGLMKLVSTLSDTGPVARPVDCVHMPDGSVLFSSDDPGRVYRVRYTGASATQAATTGEPKENAGASADKGK